MPNPSAAMRPAHDRVEVVPRHLGDGLDVTGVLGDERDDGGQDEEDRRDAEARGVPPDDLLAVGRDEGTAGKPSQAASATAEVSQRRCSVAWVAPPSTEVIGPTVASSSHDSAVPKIRARKTAMRLMNPRKATAATIVKSIVASATHWSCGQ